MKGFTIHSIAFALFCLTSSVVESFAPPVSFTHSLVRPSNTIPTETMPPALQRQRKSVAPVQTMGLFGLGAPEIAVILIAAAFLLGPQKLAELGKDAGKIAGELKEVPMEFQKGMAEGEESAKALKEEMTVKNKAVDAVKEEVKEEKKD